MDINAIITSPTFIWLMIAVGLAIVEAMTMGLTCIWFAGGAFVAAILSIFGIPTVAQIAVFVIVSCVLLFVTCPIVKKRFNMDVEQTNVNSLVGVKGTVIEPISPERAGRIVAEGKFWTAACTDDESEFKKDDIVVIKDIKGVTAYVEAE